MGLEMTFESRDEPSVVVGLLVESLDVVRAGEPTRIDLLRFAQKLDGLAKSITLDGDLSESQARFDRTRVFFEGLLVSLNRAREVLHSEHPVAEQYALRDQFVVNRSWLLGCRRDVRRDGPS
jgi:hypothetical protein